MPIHFLLYGANGYTAQLMLPLLAEYGLTPVLAGRSAEKIAPLAASYGLEYRVFDLADPAAVDRGLAGISLVLNCAGPFIHTARPMIEGCLRAGAHYLDITGEIAVFELAAGYDAEAKARGITLLPGCGLDVVPSDCLAHYLHKQLPDAVELRLAFASVRGGVSHGTATTSLLSLIEGGRVRRDGKIARVPIGHRSMRVDFGPVRRHTVAIPWGDVASAYYTTGIPNIETYMAIAPSAARWLRLQGILIPLLRLGWLRRWIQRRIDRQPAGPDAERRAGATTYFWGEVRNAAGERREARLQTPEGYTLTAHTSLLLVKKIMTGEDRPGFQTPAGLFTNRLILKISNTKYY